MNRVKILIIDDDMSLVRVMEHHLSEAGYIVASAAHGREGLALQKADPALVIFTDLKMPEMDGIEFMHALRQFDATAGVVVITGFPTIDSAVDAMKAGALDFLQKPVEKEHLLTIARKAVEFAALKSENTRLRRLVAEQLGFGAMIGRSSAMQDVYRQAKQAAASNATVLISGETGTGKEMLAKAVHSAGNRSDKPFVAVNCAAVPASLLESELFGHVKGAFTGAISDRNGLIGEAQSGTFFLDEIGDLPLELQPKLLRLLQEREYQPVGANSIRNADVRFIVATHRDLKELVRIGSFREDLYFRLNVIPLRLPPLRERREDIVPLFMHFLSRIAEREQRRPPRIDKDAARRLECYDWPGNIRELQNLAERIIALHTDELLHAEDLPEPFETAAPVADKGIDLPQSGIDLEQWIDKVVISALDKNDWNQSKAAKFLNISRNTLVYRMDKRKLRGQ
ncbi:MAG: response regulator [Chitinivibrionales bacterium]|nr:response regulator [Chitinivibrionales bacterium]